VGTRPSRRWAGWLFLIGWCGAVYYLLRVHLSVEVKVVLLALPRVHKSVEASRPRGAGGVGRSLAW
jgi:hypothetical protein